MKKQRFTDPTFIATATNMVEQSAEIPQKTVKHSITHQIMKRGKHQVIYQEVINKS